MNLALYSSVKDNWETPQAFFDKLNEEFRFTLDACASAENAKCRMFFSTKENGLVQDWEGHVIFCNPPYGRKISAWVEKCYEESRKKNTKVVMLLPARTDTIYFHKYIFGKVNEIRFIKGRLKFSNSQNSAPFPSMVVVF